MNSYKKTSFFLACILCASLSFAQPNQELRPKSFLISARLIPAPAELVYPFDLANAEGLDRREDKAGHMPSFARSIATDINLSNSGTWSPLPDGGRLWRLRLSAPGALGLIPCFDQFFIPAGAALHVYVPARDEVTGAFTAANNPADGRFNTGLIHGDVCIIEYYEPTYAAGQGKIHLNELGYAYRMVPIRKESQGIGFGGSEVCEVNVRCPEGNNWQDQKNAVVRIMVKTGPNYGWCSGSLVNNANLDCTPYILSADHCYQDGASGAISSGSDLSQWMFYFQYESPTCSNPVSEGTLGNNSVTGCSFVAASLDTGGNSGSDFVLLKLNNTPPLSYIPYYAGWSNVNTAAHNGVDIHHPSGDIKKISTYTTTLQSVSWGNIAAGTHWQVQWAPTVSGNGVTEPGSSGSPIFDVNHHIIGTLTGGSSDCTAPLQNDFFGKFAYHWTSNGATANKRLQNWLDPSNTGIQTLDGQYGPCSSSVGLDAAVTAIQQSGPICNSSIAISCTLMNYGNQQLVQDSLTFVIDGGSPQQLVWSGSLNSFQSTTVALSAQNFSTGLHTITITSSAPNGGVDGNPVNDSRTSTFSVVAPTGQYSFFLKTGDQGSQITWEVADQQNNVLYSGGPYTDNASGQIINQSWCLPVACYTFTIFSVSGNGLVGNSLSGTYNIKNNSSAVVAQLQTLNFGNSESSNFCHNPGLGVANIDAALASISIYPNPSSGIYTISDAQHATSVTVTDALGRLIMTSAMKDQSTRQIDLSAEESGVYFFKFTSDNGSMVRKVILNSGK